MEGTLLIIREYFKDLLPLVSAPDPRAWHSLAKFDKAFCSRLVGRQATRLDIGRIVTYCICLAQLAFYRIVYSSFLYYLSYSALFLCWSCSCRFSYSLFFFTCLIFEETVHNEWALYLRPIINETSLQVA